jgi:hypothetical protein
VRLRWWRRSARCAHAPAKTKVRVRAATAKIWGTHFVMLFVVRLRWWRLFEPDVYSSRWTGPALCITQWEGAESSTVAWALRSAQHAETGEAVLTVPCCRTRAPTQHSLRDCPHHAYIGPILANHLPLSFV